MARTSSAAYAVAAADEDAVQRIAEIGNGQQQRNGDEAAGDPEGQCPLS